MIKGEDEGCYKQKAISKPALRRARLNKNSEPATVTYQMNRLWIELKPSIDCLVDQCLNM